MDSKKKSIFKTVSWRIIAIIISYIVLYIYTKSASMSLEVVLIGNIISMVGYYFHERVWGKYN